jgi:hypothetical protein
VESDIMSNPQCLKDLGKKLFAFSKIANEGLALLEKVQE